ncbi:hypothetical protein [Thalassospira sp.]|uniref:hypothetical protein n=1 Tax=Thalassospira sp. TaxID=1912094 RepID=UPI001B24B532|nr:hypothetical protein [Thalassospira sp.]MBO6808448.1 hypothetical protein [Thalassospira sp.]MBO6839854.1 hypothetical protein [Thalassospira sp.]
MSKPMLIEALKPGMRAKLGNGAEVWRTENYIRSKTITKISNVTYLTSTDYEIIPDEPKPWEPSRNDLGYTSCRDFDDIIECEFTYAGALRTKDAAKRKAELDHIFTAILNMPGACEGPGACVYWGNPRFKAHQTPGCWAMEIPFDTLDNAEAAAKYANKLMEASHA